MRFIMWIIIWLDMTLTSTVITSMWFLEQDLPSLPYRDFANCKAYEKWKCFGDPTEKMGLAKLAWRN